MAQPMLAIYYKYLANGWHYRLRCLACSSQRPPKIFIFSIALSDDYSFEQNFIDGIALQNFALIISWCTVSRHKILL